MRIRFLADANLDQDIVSGILRREPDVDFELPQGVIPEGMPDPGVLAVAASLGRILVTHDIRTMPPALRRVHQRPRLSRVDFGSKIAVDWAGHRRDPSDLEYLGS